MIKFNKFHITDGVTKARVRYSHHVSVSTGNDMITIYEKNYGDDLTKIFFSGVQNDSDSTSDYFENNRIRIPKGDPLYDNLLNKMKVWGVA